MPPCMRSKPTTAASTAICTRPASSARRNANSSAACCCIDQHEVTPLNTPIYDIPVRRITGADASLREFKGQVVLIVNVASKCGLTPQYEGLEKLYEEYRAQGLVVAAFSANDFAGQEPGTNDEIQAFCQTSFGVQFPLFERITVVGPPQHPLYPGL